MKYKYPLEALGKYVSVQGGFAFKSRDFQTFGVPVLKIKNVRLREVDTSEVDYVDEEVARSNSNYFCKHGDLLISMTGSGPQAPNSVVGRVARFTGKDNKFLLNQRVGRFIIKNKEKVDARYLFYVLTQRECQWELVSIATGSANQANISVKQIERLGIPLPPLDEQKAIAHILGTLDDKIELNQHMNRTLEGIARAIFKSWFIDFDPVRAKMDGGQPAGMDAETAALFPDEFEDSPLGKIPKGWRVVPLPKAIEVNPKRSLSKGQLAPYLDMKSMPTQGHTPDEWIYREFSSGTKFIQGDTLMARITPCLENGKTAFVDFMPEKEVGWGSTEYIVLRPKPPLPLELGYFLARSDELKTFAVANMTGSSGRQRVPPDCFSSFLLALPPEKISVQFGSLVTPFMKVIRQNVNQNKFLSSIRDTLLPKLLSGEICVKDAEKVLEEVV